MGKDTINKWIISFLSVGKRGFKSNFNLASIFLLIPPLAQACSLCPIQNSKFKIPFAARTLTHPITPIIARVAHTPRWRLSKKFILNFLGSLPIILKIIFDSLFFIVLLCVGSKLLKRNAYTTAGISTFIFLPQSQESLSRNQLADTLAYCL